MAKKKQESPFVRRWHIVSMRGRDCVVVHLKTGVLRIGTDDAENLAGVLRGKIGAFAH